MIFLRFKNTWYSSGQLGKDESGNQVWWQDTKYRNAPTFHMQQFVSTFGDTPEGFRPFRGTFRPFVRRKTFKKNKRKENHIGYINLKIIKQLNYET